MKKFRNSFLEKSQELGKALMFAVSILPVSAILLGIGYWLQISNIKYFSLISYMFTTVGMSLIDNIPIIFAVGVSYGLSEDKNISAAFAGLINYLLIVKILSPSTVSLIKNIPLSEVNVAFNNINNQFIGLLSAVIAARTYNKYKDKKLIPALSFYSGKRLVPIISSIKILMASLVLYYAWPVIYSYLIAFGTNISKLGPLGAGIYGFFNRLLIPLGLHHPLNSVFWFDLVGINDIGNFWASTGILGKTGMYQAGFFPIMMFGLPGAALAISKSATPGNINKTRSFMLTAAVASFLTGITEPLEFSFMFLAPGLYFIHAFLTGLSLFIASFFQWIGGFIFSAGLIDFILSIKMPLSNKIIMLLIQGIFFFFLYYFSFLFFIKKFNIQTPGRERSKKNNDYINMQSKDYKKLAKNIVKAVGGQNNIKLVDICITRLRFVLNDSKLVNKEKLYNLGAISIIENENNLHIIIGPQVSYILEEIKKK